MLRQRSCLRKRLLRIIQAVPPCILSTIKFPQKIAVCFDALYRSPWDIFLTPSITVHVHISNLAAQTGASLFLQRNAPPFYPGLAEPPHTNWTYDKTENLSLVDLTRSRNVTHLIAEVSVLESSHAHGWTPVALIGGFDGWRFHGKYGLRVALAEGLSGLGNILEMRRSGKLVILARKGET